MVGGVVGVAFLGSAAAPANRRQAPPSAVQARSTTRRRIPASSPRSPAPADWNAPPPLPGPAMPPLPPLSICPPIPFVPVCFPLN